jgi:cytochrome c553
MQFNLSLYACGKIQLRLGFFILTMGTLSVIGSAVAADVNLPLSDKLEAGKMKANQVCSNCHGLYGQGSSGGNSAISPKITAQQKPYLIAKLKDYKSGKISHPQMSFIAQMLTEQDIDNVSQWYSSIKIDSPWFSPAQSGSTIAVDIDGIKLAPKMLAGKLKAEQVCSSCHGVYGQAVSATNSNIIPNLTGQQKEYMIARLKDYKTDAIQHPQMSLIAKMLTKQDIENVSSWYSGINITVVDSDL